MNQTQIKFAHEQLLSLTIDGHEISLSTSEPLSVVHALWKAGVAKLDGVGCLEGVCGSCRVMVRRAGQSEIQMALACETLIEDGMEVLFLNFTADDHHRYQLDQIRSSWEAHGYFHQSFPEVKSCRNCRGCIEACPKSINVQRGVELAATGKFREAGELFLECTMCGFCRTGCPENIAPNHVGLFCRRVTAYFHLRPSNLINRLEELRQGELQVAFKQDGREL